MRPGTENTKQIIILVVLVVVGLFTTYRWLNGNHTAQSATAVTPAPTRPATQVVSRVGRARKPADTLNPLDPTLRFDLLKNSEQREYTSGHRNIFQPQVEDVEIPKPKCNGTAKDCNNQNSVNTPPQPPVNTGPPLIDLKFFGFASSPGSAKKIFLASGDDVFIAAEGEIVNRRYRVVRIQANSVEIEDVLNNNKQTIPLSQG